MKLEPLFKLEKRNTIKLKKFDDDIILANYDVIVILLVLRPIWSNRKAGVKMQFLLSH